MFAALWLGAASLLWDSTVPNGLELPPIDVAERIDPAVIERAERYETFFRVLFFASQAVLLVVLALYARRGIAFARESAAGRIGTGIMLGMLGLGLAWLSQLPFRIAGIWWRRRYDQTDSGYLESLFANWLELGAEFLFVAFALGVVMALAGRFPRRWWIAAAPVFVALGALFSLVTPYLAETEKLDRPELEAAAQKYAEAQGIDPVPVRKEDVTDFTSAPNAYAAGLGPTRTIVLWTTLLDGSFTDDEVELVVAHEVAHHSSAHLAEGLAWYALFAFPGVYVIALVARRRGGMARPEAVPLALLVLVVLELLSAPVYNVISRRMETEADWKALETTRDPDAATGVFRAFTVESLNDPDPPTWAYVLFDSHPSIEERIALAEAWRRLRR